MSSRKRPFRSGSCWSVRSAFRSDWRSTVRKLIRTVGSEITELDKIRAFCIAMAAAITVIIASQLGLPVSSTHIAVGGVLGVGFLREFLEANFARMIDEIKLHHQENGEDGVEAFLEAFEHASVHEKWRNAGAVEKQGRVRIWTSVNASTCARSTARIWFKRSILLKIVAAWLITVPLAAIMAALLYFTIRGMLLP